MALTQEQKRRVDFLRASVRLQDPATERDPAYRFTDEELWDILAFVTPIYSPHHTIETIPENELYFPVLLAKKEICYRLASSSAPFYPLKAEGASLEKNVRFDHYMLLIRQVDREYRTMREEFMAGDGVARSYDVKLTNGMYVLRNYNLSERQKPILTVNPSSESAEITWSKFDTSKGMFSCYKLYVTNEPVIDEFAEYQLSQSAIPVLHTIDIHRIKWRVTGLTPDTEYIATIVHFDRNGLFGYAEQSFKTMP